MKWAIAGPGAHALQRIVPALRATGKDTFVGAAGSTPQKAAAFAETVGEGAIGYPSYEALLADPAVEAVFITTPNDAHLAQTVAAARAGKHVLVEKPMALTVADCEAMIAACAGAGVALGVGFQQRHAPVHREIRRLVAGGALGDIVLARGEWHTAYPAWTNWRADPAKAGSDILSAVGVHVFDLLSFLLGSDVAETAEIVDISGETGLDQTIAAALRYESGAIGTVTLTRRARTAENSVFVLGTKGSATGVATLGMTPTGRLATTIDGNAGARDFPVVDLYAAQFEAFAEAVASGTSPDASGLDGLKSVALCERLLRKT